MILFLFRTVTYQEDNYINTVLPFPKRVFCTPKELSHPERGRFYAHKKYSLKFSPCQPYQADHTAPHAPFQYFSFPLTLSQG